MMLRVLLTIALSLTTLAGSPARAQDRPDGLISAALLPGWQTSDGTRMAALHLTLAPGWKTYWRSPGEAGIPATFDWAGSDNLRAVAFHWPRPEVVEISGYRTLVHPGELVLPIEVTLADPGEPLTLSATVNLGICKDICVPVTLQLTARAEGAGQPDPAIQAALAAQPDDARSLGLGAARCTAEPIRDGMRLTASLPAGQNDPEGFATIELMDRSVWVAPVETRSEAGRLVQVADLVPPEAAPFALDRSKVRLTLFNAGEVIEFRGCKG